MFRKFATVLGVLALCVASPALAQRRPTVAIITDGPSDAYRRICTALATEVNTLLGTDEWTFPDAPTHEGDYSAARATALLQEALADREIDIVIGLGMRIGQAVGATEQLSKPVFLPFASPTIQGLPSDGNSSGRDNLSYLSGLIDLPRELTRFQDVVRRPSVTVVIDQHYFDSIEDLAGLISSASGEGLAVQVVAAGDSAQSILAAIPSDAQSVYLGPLLKMPASDTSALIDGLNARGLPTYASEGREWVEMGAFVTLTPGDDLQRRMRRVALNIEALSDGGQMRRFGVGFASRTELVINMATARLIHVWPRFELMTEAELVHTEPAPAEHPLDLRSAVRRALTENIALSRVRQNAELASAQANEARGALFPTLDASADFQWIDPDIAFAPGNAERTLSWGIQAQQLIYSPQVWGARRSTRTNERAVAHAIVSTELDTVANTIDAYLGVLRALTVERVNRENLQRVRRNLALAEVRVSVGAAGRQEVFRWRAEVANSRTAIVNASARRNQAEILLNRILNRDSEAAVTVIDPGDDAELALFEPRIGEYVQDPWTFRVFRSFMVQEAIRNSPEVRQLDAAIDAQGHTLHAQRLGLFVPDIFVTGGINHIFHRSGAGSGAVGGVEPDRFNWQVGLGLRFNLFDAARYAQIDQVEVAVSQLHQQRADITQQIEQQARAALHQVGASSASVALTRDASEAAAENLTLVTEAYRLGTENIITLLDAQTQALQSDLAAANARFDFLSDFAIVERASGAFGFMAPQSERDEFMDRLQVFARERTGQAEAASEETP